MLERLTALDVEIDSKAARLSEDLERFVRTGPVDIDQVLPETLISVKENAIPEVLDRLVDHEFQAELNRAMDLAFQTPLDLDGEKVLPWENTATVVVFDTEGKVRGAVSRANQDTSEQEEPVINHFASALSKTIASMYLYDLDMSGGIGDYTRDLKKASRDEFKGQMGSIEKPLRLDHKSTETYVGVSGCKVNLGAAAKVFGPTSSYPTQAGVFDEAFAGLVGFYLQNPKLPVQNNMFARGVDRFIAGSKT